jgi:hypothetical protein
VCGRPSLFLYAAVSECRKGRSYTGSLYASEGRGAALRCAALCNACGARVAVWFFVVMRKISSEGGVRRSRGRNLVEQAAERFGVRFGVYVRMADCGLGCMRWRDGRPVDERRRRSKIANQLRGSEDARLRPLLSFGNRPCMRVSGSNSRSSRGRRGRSRVE